MDRTFLSWPPPGLERIQGAIGPISRLIGIGGFLLAVPLLWSVGDEAAYYQFGPFGRNWWAASLLSALGLILLIVGVARLLVALRVARRGAAIGHGLLTILQTAADTTRDTGFLLQGARTFSGMEEGQRRGLMFLRLAGRGLSLAGLLWIPLGIFLALVLASRASVGAYGLWALTLGPAGLLLLAALFCRLGESSTVHRASSAAGQAAEEDLEVQYEGWREACEERGLTGMLGRGAPGRTRLLGGAALGLTLATLLVFLAVSGVVLLSAAGPIAADISVPRYQGVQEKAVVADVLRPFRLEPDPTITPVQAGQAVRVFTQMGTDAAAYVTEPVRTYDRWWDRHIHFRRVVGLFPDAARGSLSDADREYLMGWYDLPAAAEYAVMARARRADIAGTRWRTPFPEGLTAYELPIPRYRGFTDGVKGQVATAVVLLADGWRAEAENALLEVLSAGFLLMDDDPALIGNLIGIVAVGYAAEGLEAFYRATGRTEEADRIAQLREGARQSLRSRRSMQGPLDTQSAILEMAQIAIEPGSLRGLRWEFVAAVSAVSPCINLHGAVYGPGPAYYEWLETAERGLVRYESEEHLFELYSSSDKLSRMGEEPGLFWKVYGGILGLLGLPDDCGLLIASGR